MSKGISKKQKDILNALILVNSKIKEDCKRLEVIDKKLKHPEMKKYHFIAYKRLKFKMLFEILSLKNKSSLYKSLRNLEKRGLVEIKRDKSYFVDINVIKKGKSLIS